MKLPDLYRSMRERNLVTCNADFSTEWLGEHADYYMHRQAGNIALAPRVRLLQRLEAEGNHPDLIKAASRIVEAVLTKGEKTQQQRMTKTG